MNAKRNLKGYKREGKRFIPPMKQLHALRETSYVKDMLPELIWLGLLHDRHGYGFGSAALKAIVNASKSWPAPDKPVNYAIQSTYGALSPDQQQSTIAALAGASLLEEVRFALAPLVMLYPGFGLSFLGPPPTSIPEEVLTQQISDSIQHHLDKYETPGIVLNGSMLLTRLIAGTIKFSSTIEIPDFNAVVERPDSSEAKKAASFMRANALAEFGMLDVSPTWAMHFWNRCAELSPCNLPDYAHGW